MSLDAWTVLLAVAPAVVGALLPRKWLAFAFGWYAFLVGLLFLEYRPLWPFAREDRGEDWLWLAAAAGLAALAVRRAVDLLRRRPPARFDFASRFLLSWELPGGIVLALFAFEGLSEVMAGFRPAWLAHLLVVIGIGIGFANLLRHFTVRVESPPVTAMLLAAVFLVVMTGQVAGAASHAWILSGRASHFADGSPYCILAFDRAGRPRAATSMFDLSSLVMRSGGRYAGDEEAWLVVRDRYGSAAYFYTFGPRYFELAPNGGQRPFACTPS